MKTLYTLLLAFVTSFVSAQLLNSGNGQLPTCAQQCNAFTTAASNCGSSWACFCSKVYAASNQDLTTVCAAACPNPTDNTAVVTWYTANCGDDNGASEHGTGGGGGNGNGNGNGGSPSTSASAAAPSSSTTSTGVESAGAPSSNCGGTWWHCHWVGPPPNLPVNYPCAD